MNGTIKIVGLYDVLGFSELVESKSLHEIYAMYLLMINEKMYSYRMARAGGENSLISTTIFSDTILIWADATEDGIQEFIRASSYLMAGLCDLRIPLRGGVSIGEAVMDKSRRVFIGRPIVESHRAEQSQQWMGIGFSDKCFEKEEYMKIIKNDEDVVEYHVPVKDGRAAIKYCLNWCQYSYGGGEEPIMQMMNTSPEDVAEKYQNTLAFVRAHRLR